MSDKLSTLHVVFSSLPPHMQERTEACMHACTDATIFKLGMYNVRDAITLSLTAHKHTVLYNAR